MSTPDRYREALERVNHWGLLLTGRLLGTVAADDPKVQGYRDLFQKLFVLRIEVTALTHALLEAGITTDSALFTKLVTEAEMLDELYATQFPGVRSTECGLEVYDPKLAATYMKDWPA